MTNEERFKQNIKIAYKIAWKYRNTGIEFDDLKQICLLGLWKAILTYKIEKGTISTYAYSVIKNEINIYIRKNKKYFKDKHFEEEIKEGITLGDAIKDSTNEIEEVEKRIDIKASMNSLQKANMKKKEKQVMEFYLKGYIQPKIAKKVGLSQPSISITIKRLKKYIKGEKNA